MFPRLLILISYYYIQICQLYDNPNFFCKAFRYNPIYFFMSWDLLCIASSALQFTINLLSFHSVCSSSLCRILSTDYPLLFHLLPVSLYLCKGDRGTVHRLAAFSVYSLHFTDIFCKLLL